MNVLRLFLPLLLLLVTACDYGRMWETPAVRPHEEEILVTPEGTVPFEGGEEIFRLTPAEDLRPPFSKNDPTLVEQGKGLYLTYCAQCHGKDYDGNGTVGQSFSPLPTNLRSPSVQGLFEGKLFKDISYGIPNKRQPPLASTIDLQDRWRIIAFVKSLSPGS
jgi:mono/diheme cytochrome c family protein